MSVDRQRRHGRVGFDDFLEDTIGLNLRGLKTLATVIVKPRRYFTAANDPDWYGLYTPSIRLWLSVVAVIFFFRFFWGAETSPLIVAIELQLAQSAMPLPEGMSYSEAAHEIGQLYFGLSPFCMIGIYLAVGAVWPFWGRKTTFALRERYLFAALLPSTVFVLATTLLIAVVPADNILAYAAITLAINFLVDSQTLFRGAYSGKPIWGRLWRSLLLAGALVVAGVAASVLAQYLALIIFFA